MTDPTNHLVQYLDDVERGLVTLVERIDYRRTSALFDTWGTTVNAADVRQFRIDIIAGADRATGVLAAHEITAQSTEADQLARVGTMFPVPVNAPDATVALIDELVRLGAPAAVVDLARSMVYQPEEETR